GGWYAASLSGQAATMFFAPVAGGKSRVFVALADPAPTGGGGKLPLVMLVVGPLLVGFVGWLVATGYGKPLHALSKELDRLGSSGDPTRHINAQGPEANAIARSVERMISTLNFRAQHEMTDLQDVVAE